MLYWNCSGSVALEKLIRLDDWVAGSSFIRYIRIVEVLAVPGPPTIKLEVMLFSLRESFFFSGRRAILVMMNSLLVESIVGIRS